MKICDSVRFSQKVPLKERFHGKKENDYEKCYAQAWGSGTILFN